MNFKLTIKGIKSLKKLDGYWTDEDYINLLDELDYPDARQSDPADLLDLLSMAITDLEPHESAEILLRYKLKDQLNEGQIQNLSHDMTEDNESEHNANIALHHPMFNINQLLRQCYNGVFPSAKATQIEFELEIKSDKTKKISHEIALKAISQGLTERSPLVRLFEDQLNGKQKFKDAEKVIWELNSISQNQYLLITSDYWISAEDIAEYEFSGSIKLFEEK